MQIANGANQLLAEVSASKITARGALLARRPDRLQATSKIEAASKVSRDGRSSRAKSILGEEENLTQGMTGSFSLTLEQGRYTLRCNNGEQEDGTLTVSGMLESEGSPAVGGAEEREAGGAGTSRRGNP